ncbi:hypothetical protein GCM10009000_008790 [Halobacterium noricense]|uniref:Uncharacterized protein n=1 Tax=Haladaptatus pallidirubidus TaxID=1008152 RepID=A0AAV3UQR8_9EURY
MPTIGYLNYDVLDDQGWDMNDDDLFDKAAAADFDDEDYGSLDVNEGEYILEAAEAQGALLVPRRCLRELRSHPLRG